MSTLIKNGTVVNGDGERRVVDVLIVDGIIKEVAPGISAPAGVEIVDASGMYVVPGGMDAHVHLEMPIGPDVSTIDDFETGSKAALLGGTTSFIDFVNPDIGGSYLDAFDDWERRAKERAVIDYAFHVTISWWGEHSRQWMEELVTRGVTSFKHFFAYKGRLMLDDTEMLESFQACRALSVLPTIHCENGHVVDLLQQRLLDEGRTGPEAHPHSRPAYVEAEAVERACACAEAAQTPLLVVHNTNKASVDAISRAKARGQRVFAEVCGAHLSFTDAGYQDPDWRVAASHMLSPPLRSAADREALWGEVMADRVDLLSSDHCAWSDVQREAGKEDFTKVPNGMPGIQERVMVAWNAVMAGRITLDQFVTLTSAAPARIYGLYGKKGVIRAGADGDVALWDPTEVTVLDGDTLGTRAETTPARGMVVQGRLAAVLARGVVMVRDGRLTGEAKAGTGQYMGREAGTPFVFGKGEVKK